MAALRLESPQLSFVDGSLGIGRFAQAPIRIYPGFLVAAGLLARTPFLRRMWRGGR
jgi:hypothetical protein